MENDDIDSILKRYNENQAYINGLIKSETSTGYKFSEDNIKQSRKLAKEFLRKLKEK